MTQFVDERLDANVEQGASGGPSFYTSIIDLANAAEQRNENWAYSRQMWDISYGIQSTAEFDAVLSLFYVTAGRTFGFRFQDWSDYTLGMTSSFNDDNQVEWTSTAASSQILGLGDNVTTVFQMFKAYETETAVFYRPITRPVQGTTTVYLNGTPLSEGSDFTVNYDTGAVTFASAKSFGQVLTYSVQFDVPVRFDSDMMQQKVTYATALQSGGIKIIELKEYTGAFNLPTLKLSQPAYPIQWNPADTVVGTVSDQAVALSQDGKTAYFFKTGNGSTAGVKVVDLTVATETGWSVYADLFTTAGRTVSNINAVGTDGYLYMIDGFPSDWTPLVKISPFSLQEVGHFGTDAAGLGDVDQLVPMHVTGGNMMLCSSALGINGYLVNVDTMTLAGSYTHANTFGAGLSISPGVQTSGSVYTAYALQTGASGEASNQIDVLSFAIEAASLTASTIVSFVPSAIDASWTEFTQTNGPIYDESDGNLIFQFQDSLATVTSYILKVNSSTGAIMWQTAGSANLPSTYQTVVDGTLVSFANLSGGQQARQTINTSTGVITTLNVNMTGIGDFVEYAGYGTVLFFGSLTGYVSSQWAMYSPYGSILLRQAQFAQFVDERLDTDIETGASGGPVFLTTVIPLDNAFEGRNQEWQYPLQNWNIAYGVMQLTDFQDILNMFYVCRGRAAGFRFRDWTDYQIGDTVYYVASKAQSIGTGNGSNAQFQIFKQYNSITGQFLRPVTRPVSGTLEVYVSGTLQVENTAFTANYDTGLITFLSGHIPAMSANVAVSVIFDVPVRFDDDEFKQKITWVGATELEVIKIKEIKEYGGGV